MQTDAPTLKRFIRPRELAARLGVHKTTIWREVKRGALPPPTRLTKGAIGWTEDEIVQALANRHASRKDVAA
jgi:predicted DNA-binding transcriptional regulator AlpA